MSENIARQKVSVKMKIKSTIECDAQNKTVLVFGYEAATFWQLRERDQYLLEKQRNMCSARVISDLVLILTTFLLQKGSEFSCEFC